MLTGKSIIEKLSYIDISRNKNSLVLYDYLYENRYEINQLVYDFLLEIDGKKDIEEISRYLSTEYNTDIEVILVDIIPILQQFAHKNIILVKNSPKYNVIKLYYKIIFVKE